MPTDVTDALEFDPPDAETVYANHCETCRRLGVEPVSQERAQGLMAEWSDALAGRRLVPPNTH